MPNLLSPKPLPGVTPGTPVTPPKPDLPPGVNIDDVLTDPKTGKVLINPQTGKPMYKPGRDPNKPDLLQGGAAGVLGTVSNPSNPLAPITAPFEVFSKLSNVYLWKRIGIVALGGLIIWWAILIFIATNKKLGGAIQNGAKTIISKTPQGAAANIVTGSVGL